MDNKAKVENLADTIWSKTRRSMNKKVIKDQRARVKPLLLRITRYYFESNIILSQPMQQALACKQNR